MSIKLSDNIRIGQQKPIEDKYFNELNPYTSTAEVNTLLPKSLRYIGLTVNINGEEYWYKHGIGNDHLIKKLDFHKNYSFYTRQLGFFEYYNDNGQIVEKPYYSQMFKCEPDVDGYYPIVPISSIDKLLEKKVFQDVIQELHPRYSIVEINGNYIFIYTYMNQLSYSVGEGINFISEITTTSAPLTNLSSYETTQQNNNIGTVYIYLEFTLSNDQETILE